MMTKSGHTNAHGAQDDLSVDYDSEQELGDITAAKAKLKKLREELDAVKAQRQEYLDGWQRCKADSINLRRDLEAQGKRTGELLREALVHDIIPALDSFDMATGNEAWASVSDGWKSGMEYVREQLLSALRSHGIERYGSVGEKFDHAVHEAIEERSDAPGASGTVARVVRYGYRAGERILRPAQVVVKK